jgi:hypothetical protein
MSKTIWTALHAAKQELGKVPKDATNPFFKSKYFDINGLLDVVEPVLHKNGLFVIQPIIDGKVTTKIVYGETGESIASEMQLSDNKDPQKQGSEITYYRRYTLQSLLAMQADDDDGNAASKAAKPAQPAAALPAMPTSGDIWNSAITKLKAGTTTIEKIKKAYSMTDAVEAKLKEAVINA